MKAKWARGVCWGRSGRRDLYRMVACATRGVPIWPQEEVGLGRCATMLCRPTDLIDAHPFLCLREGE